MNNKLKSLTFFIIPFILVVACSKSGTKALEKGDYYNAVLQATDKLTKDIDNEKSLAVLPDAYRYASEDLLADISSAKNANQQFRWERVLDGYEKLNNMHDQISRCASCRREVNSKSYFTEDEEAREFAAYERYEYADEMLNKGTIEAAREAFFSYELISVFAPNYKDVNIKLEEALYAASYHVVVEQANINSRTYELSQQYFQERIDEFLRENRRLNQFIRFYSPEEAKSASLNPDHLIKLGFVDFIVGETLLEREEITVTSEDSVKTGTVTLRGEKIDVYDKVSAKLSNNRKIISSRGILSMEIKDFQNNRILRKEEFPGEFTWVNEWSSFNGDERALTLAELELTKNKEEVPPAPQQLFIEFSKPIYNQLTNSIKHFYDNY